MFSARTRLPDYRRNHHRRGGVNTSVRNTGNLRNLANVGGLPPVVAPVMPTRPL